MLLRNLSFISLLPLLAFSTLFRYNTLNRPEAGVYINDTSYGQKWAVPPLPGAVSLDMPEPGDQGKQHSCAAWAVVYDAGSYYMHFTKGQPYGDSGKLSPMFVYNQLAKGRSGITSLLDNLIFFKKEGACSLKTMPYNAYDCSTQPDSAQRLDAEKHTIIGWQQIDSYNLYSLKTILSQKKPVIFSIVIDEGFDKITAPFIWEERCGRLEQTHTMVITGYDDSRHAFLVMNSWGITWADKGFVWIDYDFFLKNVLGCSYVLI
jgi:hypothetical protein